MIELKLKQKLDESGRSKYWLMQETNKSFQSVTNLMKDDLAGIHFDTLEKLCNVFECTPGDLLVISKNSKKRGD